MERSSDRVCTRCEAVMWTGDRYCPRCGQPRSPAAAPPPPPPRAEPQQDWTPPAPQRGDANGAWQGSGAVAAPPRRRDVEIAPAPERRSRNGVLVAAAALLVAAVVVAGVVLWRTGALGGQDAEASTATPSPSASEPAGGADEDDPSASASEPLPTTGESLVDDASVDAPPPSATATDGNGDVTSYEAANMLDGDPETTWRADGDASGETITFTFDGERTISELGLINGYAKTDPASGADRYSQTRRITAVTWTIGADRFDQRLDDDDRGLQTLEIRPVKGDEVVLEIDGVTGPGEPFFDHTAISEVEILG